LISHSVENPVVVFVQVFCLGPSILFDYDEIYNRQLRRWGEGGYFRNRRPIDWRSLSKESKGDHLVTLLYLISGAGNNTLFHIARLSCRLVQETPFYGVSHT
jgi:hypothetical protein